MTCAIEGVVVEILHGVDALPEVVREFQPGPSRRLGVLVDHLVRGSKEAADRCGGPARRHVLVTGHPYVDVWQAVKPSVGRHRRVAAGSRAVPTGRRGVRAARVA